MSTIKLEILKIKNTIKTKMQKKLNIIKIQKKNLKNKK